MLSMPTMEDNTYPRYARELLDLIAEAQHQTQPNWSRNDLLQQNDEGEWFINLNHFDVLLPHTWLSLPDTPQQMGRFLDNASVNQWGIMREFAESLTGSEPPLTPTELLRQLFVKIVVETLTDPAVIKHCFPEMATT